MCLCNPTKSRKIRRCNTQFVDDCDGWASARHDSDDPIGEALDKMQADAQRWNNLNNITGQTVAFHKCKWQILAWKVLKNELVIDYATNEKLILHDNKGGIAVIDFAPPDQPNKGLGYYLCPDGKQDHHYNELVKSVQELCAAVASANLSVREAKQVIWQRLLPKLDYGLHAAYFNKKESKGIDKIVNGTFLRLLKMNRNTPRAVIHGPTKYGGMAIPDCY